MYSVPEARGTQLTKTMKKLLIYGLAMMIATMCFAQKDVTKFLGIPVDGTKSAMIQKLKAKGFTYNQRLDCLEGEFNGRAVRVLVVTNNDKVYRIMVSDAYGVDEYSIKIRFNTLCRQFTNNGKYYSPTESQEIDDSENISYEMTVHKKRYEAAFSQTGNATSLEDCLATYALEHGSMTQEEWNNLSESERIELMKIIITEVGKDDITKYCSERLNYKSVWFMIDEDYGEYRIIMYYDNGYNQANGEDL